MGRSPLVAQEVLRAAGPENPPGANRPPRVRAQCRQCVSQTGSPAFSVCPRGGQAVSPAGFSSLIPGRFGVPVQE